MTGPTFTDLRQRLAQDVPQGRCDEIGVRRLWWAALETLQQDLLERGIERGIWLAAPLPALYEPELLKHLQGWVWAPERLDQLSPHPTALPGRSSSDEPGTLQGCQRLSLRRDDGDDPLLLVITPEVQVALALHGPAQKRQLLMRSDPETLSDVLLQLGRRLEHQSPAEADQLRKALESIGTLQGNGSWSEQFWPRLTERLTGTAPGLMLQPIQAERPPEDPSHGDLNLLEAITHEVRTPLATIRTLIRSLLRRKDLPEVVVNRLRQIDVECSEQIDRFGLIFHAAELQREPNEANLARTDLHAILTALAPSWTEQLDRRGISLELDLTADLPAILSDSRRLEPMLGGLIDRCTRGLAPCSQLTLHLQAAGPRVKLQLHVEHPNRTSATEPGTAPQHEEVGTVLSWDPSTGSLQLSQDATRQMMASLGGRYQSRRDRDITVFFPVHTPGN